MSVQPPPPPPVADIPGFVLEQMPPPWVTLPPGLVAMIALATIAVAGVVLYPLVQALARRLEGRRGDEALHAELEQLRQRVTELEGQAPRVAELEERLDFAERLLSKGAASAVPLRGEGPR